MKFAETDFTFHRPVDNSDPGFAIKGYKLRWLSAAVEVRRAARIWVPLKLSMLPKKVLDQMQERQPRWFGDDTIRRKDLTLAFAPLDQVNELKRELKQTQALNENVLRKQTSHGNGVESEGRVGRAADEGDLSKKFR
jgi:hypothetical protein